MAINDSQLIFINEGNDANGDASIQYANTTDTTSSIYVSFGPTETNTTLTDPVQIVADTAAGLYFVIDPPFSGDGSTPGTVREGSLTSPAQATTVAYAVPNANGFSEAFSEAIDTTHNFIYVSQIQFNSDFSDYDAGSGIVRFSYDPLTGAVGPAQAVYEPGPGTVNTYDSLSLDTAHQKLYFVNNSEGQFGSSPATNDIEVLNDLDGTGTPTVLTTLPSGANFFGPGGTNDYTQGSILSVAADTTQNLVFFSTGTGPGIDDGQPAYEALNGIWVIDGSTANQTPRELIVDPTFTIAGAVDHFYALSISFDSAHQQLWVDYASEDDHGTVGADELGAVVVYNVTGTTPGTVSLSAPTIVSLKLNEAAGALANDDFPEGSFLDDLPVLTTSGTATPATEQSAAVALLSATPGVTDPDGTHLASASVQITGGTFSSNESSAADDHLSVNGQNSGVIAGTNITVSYSSATETLTLTGYDTVASYATVLGEVQYNTTGDNPTNFGSNTTRTITWQVNDGAIGNPTGTNVATTTLTVAGVNDPPTLAGTTDASFTENGPAVTLSPAATVSDPDNLDLAGATVALTGGTFAGDGDALGAITAGTSITASYNAAIETLVLTGSDTLAHYQSVLDSVTFVTASNNPDDFGADPTRAVTWTLNDGSASFATGTATTTVSITAVNDPPTLSGIAASASYTENGSAVTLSPTAAVSDPDNLDLASATVRIVGGTFAGDGDVLVANVAGTAITASYDAVTETLVLAGSDSLANYRQVLESVAFASTSDNPDDFGADPTRTITWVVNDGSGSNNLSAVSTATVAITAVNDPPTLAGATDASFTENGPAVTLSPTAAVVDPDSHDLAGATVAITGGAFPGDGDVLAANVAGTSITTSYDAVTETLVLSGSDTLAHYQSVLDSVTFVTASDNPDDFGADPTRAVTWQLNDGSGSNNLSAVSTTTVSITAVNDPPTLAGTTDASFTENGPAVTLSSAVSISDPDSLMLAGATVALTGGTFAGDGDALAADTTGTSIAASYDAATETLVLSGSDTLAHYQQVLDSVAYVTASDNPDNFGADPSRTVTWTLDDGSASNATTSVTTMVSITAVNDPPTLAGTTNASFTENGPPVALSPAAAVTDPDNLDLASATVASTGGTFAGDGDVLGVNVAGTAITASYNAVTETLVLSGSDTLAHYQSVLDSVTFVTASDNPDDFGADPTRTVTWQLNDGSGSNNLSAVSTTTVSITAVNDPPTLSDVATTAGYTEQAAATTLSGSLAVSDPDSLTLAGATVQVTGGTFAGDGDVLAADTTGTSIAASYDAATETLILSGADTLADYQSVLDSVTFFDASDNPTSFGSNPTRTITWVVDDGGASNNTSAVATTTLNVTAVNDPPTLAGVPSTASFSAGQTVTVAPAAAVTDPDNLDLASATVAITGGTFAGDTDVLAANVSGTAITASYNAATETLTLTGSDTLAHYQQVLDSVTFTTGANPTNFGLDPTRTLTWTVDDGSGSNNTAAATTTISISTSLVKNDFDGDRRSDILFQEKLGSHFGPTLMDFMNGTTVASQATLSGPGATWKLIGSGDFNSDGRADILWQNNDGTPQIWTMNGSTVTSEVTLPDPGAAWHAVGTGDFNGDGTSDIVFQNTNGTPEIWIMNGTSVAATATLPDPGANWKLIDTGDFNGDGKSDLVFQSPNGTPMIWLMNGTSVAATATLPQPSGAGSWQLIGTGDFNGDGDADLLFQKANGTPMIWTMNGASVVGTATLANPGPQWNAVGTGDYNGDGKSDILFQNNNGTPMIWTMDGTSVTATATLPNPGAAWHANTG